MPLKTELKSGDIIEIITSKKGHPSEAWLKFVKTSNARYKIRNWMRRERPSPRTETAEEQPSKKEKTVEVAIPENELFKIKTISKPKKTALSIEGNTNVLIRLSQCCQPIPGDDVIRFITRGGASPCTRKAARRLRG